MFFKNTFVDFYKLSFKSNCTKIVKIKIEPINASNQSFFLDVYWIISVLFVLLNGIKKGIVFDKHISWVRNGLFTQRTWPLSNSPLGNHWIIECMTAWCQQKRLLNNLLRNGTNKIRWNYVLFFDIFLLRFLNYFFFFDIFLLRLLNYLWLILGNQYWLNEIHCHF